MKKFIGTFFFILALIMALAIVFDISEKMDDFLRHRVSASSIIFDYYINFIFFYSNLFSSMILFLSVIFFTSKMARNNEITAILSSGVSYNRLLLPFLVSAGIIAGVSIYMNHNVLPRSNKIRVEFENNYMVHKSSVTKAYREPVLGTIVYFESNDNHEVQQMLIRNWNGFELKKTLYAYRAICDSVTGKWTLENYFIRETTKGHDRIRTGRRLDTIFVFTATALGKKLNFASTMTTTELIKYIEEEREKGNSEIALFEIERYQRTAYPVAAFILTLIAVSVAGRKSRGGLGFNLFIGIAVAALYVFGMKITTVAATNVGFDPFLAVWLPNFIFAGVSVIFYIKAQK